jgi:hypothetical protein
MKRTDVTYGQLDTVLRGLGFSCRLVTQEPPPARVYEHQESGAAIILPAFPEKDKVLEYHLVAARVMLENYGIAEPRAFDAKLHKAGRGVARKRMARNGNSQAN